MRKLFEGPIGLLAMVCVLALTCLSAGYYAGSSNAKAQAEASIDSDALITENAKLRDDILKLEGSDYENHSDWLDCHALLKFVKANLDDIKDIDCTNPVPVIYMKDGRIMSTDGSHRVVEVNIPDAPVDPTPPPAPSTERSNTQFTPSFSA